jgi:16S rRNA (guanine966-N2)-methyltransferase
VKIVAGRFKGRVIHTESKAPYRPTSTRIRKSLFDRLGDLEGQVVLDLFAGSGILGFEAASRGARDVTFVDWSSRAVNLLRRNASKFPEVRFVFYRQDAVKFLKKCETFDVIIADPPYQEIEALLARSLVDLCLARLNPGGSFVLETTSTIHVLGGESEKTFGDTKLTFWSRSS